MRRQAAPLPQTTTPSIEHQIATQHHNNTTNTLAELVAQSLHHAITTHPNARHAAVFAAYHGLREDGTASNPPATFEQIAQTLGCSRVRVGSMYYRAAGPIFAKLSGDLLQALKTLTT